MVCGVSQDGKINNHPFCDLSKSYLLKSQRIIIEEQLRCWNLCNHEKNISVLYCENVKDRGRGFTNKDTHNALIANKKKNLDGIDRNDLLEKSKQRKIEDQKLYITCEFDEGPSLTSIVSRDSNNERRLQSF